MFELDDEDRAYLAGVAAGATLVLVALWLSYRSDRRRLKAQHLDVSVALMRNEIRVLAEELSEVQARLPQEVVE